ncbi:MAG TPA: hypothetical protein VGD62_10390 [Acidobacteriaceae bacterium]
MSTELQTTTGAALAEAARDAGLLVLSAEAGTDFHHQPTARLTLALTPDAPEPRRLHLEMTEGFDIAAGPLAQQLAEHLREAARRLVNPRPDVYVTSAGIPLRFAGFEWPFHRSTSGADTYIVHGVVHLEDGSGSPLHTKVSASMTVTFAEVVSAAEQPYAESFIYNAIRKTYDYGQLEFLKSGNRQPVPVTMRYYSRWQNRFIFTDTDDRGRTEFLAMKLYWLSGVLGNRQPIWLADPRDAQYLNTTPEQLIKLATELHKEGLAASAPALGAQYAAATPLLLDRAPVYQQKLAEALDALKPTFNEEMRGGHTNM